MPTMNEKYLDENGREWATYQDYCNSEALDFDVICVMLETGKRTPQTEWEKNYLRLHNEKYRGKGIAIEHPFD